MAQYPFLKLPNGTLVPLNKVFEIKAYSGVGRPKVTKIRTRHRTFTIHGDFSRSVCDAQLGAYGFIKALDKNHWVNLGNATKFSIKPCNDNSAEHKLRLRFNYFRSQKKVQMRIGSKQCEAIKRQSILLVCS